MENRLLFLTISLDSSRNWIFEHCSNSNPEPYSMEATKELENSNDFVFKYQENTFIQLHNKFPSQESTTAKSQRAFFLSWIRQVSSSSSSSPSYPYFMLAYHRHLHSLVPTDRWFLHSPLTWREFCVRTHIVHSMAIHALGEFYPNMVIPSRVAEDYFVTTEFVKTPFAAIFTSHA